MSGSWWSYSERTSNSRERERDRGEKSTGENGETINYLLTLLSRRENRGNFFLSHCQRNNLISAVYFCDVNEMVSCIRYSFL